MWNFLKSGHRRCGQITRNLFHQFLSHFWVLIKWSIIILLQVPQFQLIFDDELFLLSHIFEALLFIYVFYLMFFFETQFVHPSTLLNLNHRFFYTKFLLGDLVFGSTTVWHRNPVSPIIFEFPYLFLDATQFLANLKVEVNGFTFGAMASNRGVWSIAWPILSPG